MFIPLGVGVGVYSLLVVVVVYSSGLLPEA